MSLKMRLSWGAFAVVLLATFAIATIALHFVRQRLQQSIAEDQFQRLSAIADAMDLRFQSRRTLLKSLSESLELASPDSAELQMYLEKRQSLRESFDNFSLIDARGNVVANLNGALAFGSVNVADRDYFRDTFKRREGVISQPYKNRFTGAAQVAMTYPVMGTDGEIRYLLYGAINLKDRRLLGNMQGIKLARAATCLL